MTTRWYLQRVRPEFGICWRPGDRFMVTVEQVETRRGFTTGAPDRASARRALHLLRKQVEEIDVPRPVHTFDAFEEPADA